MTTSTKMLAFHGTLVTKEALLAQLRAHYAADEIIKGQYWENGRGCAIGCTIHGNNHAEYEPRFGIPQMLARLEDGIFESLPNERAKEWPIQFIEAIPVGADLSSVGAQFLHGLLVDPEMGVIKFGDERGKAVIQAVADLYARQMQGETISEDDWRAAYADASAVARAAASAAEAYAAAASAAEAARAATSADASAAAYAAARAAASAASADAYADASADSAAANARIKQADKLLELLRNAPINVSAS